ncbi:MAG: hypothetical protein HKP58_12155 [Desulfatitalea sp.]|nr:hypothetical protein [Desulfatitalea sp.]NNK01154.1 hypothetical protein [Desulfatitalea sp.]
MRYFNFIIRQLFIIFFVLQTGVAFALPSGQHLNLCFGWDGHIDMGVDHCLTNVTQSSKDTASDDHHGDGDCVDIVIGCETIEKAVLLSAPVRCPTATFQNKPIFSMDKSILSRIGNLSSNPIRCAAVFDEGAYPVTYLSQKMMIVLII